MFAQELEFSKPSCYTGTWSSYTNAVVLRKPLNLRLRIGNGEWVGRFELAWPCKKYRFAHTFNNTKDSTLYSLL